MSTALSSPLPPGPPTAITSVPVGATAALWTA